MKTLCLIAALGLLPMTQTYAHEAAPSEKVTVLQEQLLKNVPGKNHDADRQLCPRPSVHCP